MKKSRMLSVFRHGFAWGSYRGGELPEPREIEVCMKWLIENAEKKKCRNEECVGSYGLKHRIENLVGEYIPNGACIQAAIDLGFEYWRDENSPQNANFFMKLKPKVELDRRKPSGFSKWLFQQEHFYYLGDAKFDSNWPLTATRYIDFHRYLESKGESVHEELGEAWKEFCGEEPPCPDLIDTRTIEAVYDRECDFISFGHSYPKAQTGTKYLYALVEIEEEEFGGGQEKQIIEFVRVRYVGQTDDPSGRLTKHVLSPGNVEKLKWIGRLVNSGKLPQMAIFQTVLLDEACLLERAAINAFPYWETRFNSETLEFPPFDEALLNIRK